MTTGADEGNLSCFDLAHIHFRCAAADGQQKSVRLGDMHAVQIQLLCVSLQCFGLVMRNDLLFLSSSLKSCGGATTMGT